MSDEQGKRDPSTNPQVSTLAVWSFVCGTFFFLLPMGLLALILSALALYRIRRSHGCLVGHRIARIGLRLGIASILFTCVALVILSQSQFGRARESSRTISCRGNLKQIGLGIGMYESDHMSNGRQEMPPDLRTLVREGYVRDLSSFLCPDAAKWRDTRQAAQLQDPDLDGDYAYAHLINPDDAPADAPIMWDKYLQTGRRFWQWKGRLFDTVNVLQQDLHAVWMPVADLKASIERNRALYVSIPPLPIVGGVPTGWDALEYAAAAATAFYSTLILVALFRRRWLYTLLPDKPGDVPATQATGDQARTTGLPTE
jgi:hypothetical protein